MLPFYRPVACAALLVVTALACTKDKKQDEPSLPPRPVVEEPVVAKSSELGVLEVKMTVRDDGLLLEIHNAPAGSALECTMGATPLTPCQDGAIVPRPKTAGSYVIQVDANVNGARVATGQSTPVVVDAAGASRNVEDPTHPLALVFDDAAVKDGMTTKLGSDFTVRFKPRKELTCDAPAYFCRYDRSSSAFWTSCAQGRAFTIPAAVLALGAQELGIQARCHDDVGPILTLTFYGVPADYQELMLSDVHDGQGRHVIELVRDADCPETDRRMECAEKPEDAFSRCENANVLKSPKPGTRIRLACQDRRGPILTMP